MPIFRIVLKHISHYLPLLFQFEWLYLSHEFIHFEDGCSPGQKTQLEDFRPNKKVDIAVFITSTELFFCLQKKHTVLSQRILYWNVLAYFPIHKLDPQIHEKWLNVEHVTFLRSINEIIFSHTYHEVLLTLSNYNYILQLNPKFFSKGKHFA